MHTRFKRAIAIWAAITFPTSAFAGTKTGAFIGIWAFAVFMGIVAATWRVTTKWRRTGIFFMAAGLCLSASCVWLMFDIADRPFMDLIADSIVMTAFIVPLPFIAAYALFLVLGHFLKSSDRSDRNT